MPNPISINQVLDGFNLDCVTPPSCRNLKNDIEAFVKDYCETKGDLPDISNLTQQCLTFTTHEELLQALINTLCTISEATGGGGGGTTPIGPDISGLNLCDGDNWALGNLPCLFLLDSCGNPISSYDLKQILQIIIRRVIRLQNIINQQNTIINNLQITVNNLISRVNIIESNCCNVTLVSQINAMNAVIGTLDTRLDNAETNIITIQNTCC